MTVKYFRLTVLKETVLTLNLDYSLVRMSTKTEEMTQIHTNKSLKVYQIIENTEKDQIPHTPPTLQ